MYEAELPLRRGSSSFLRQDIHTDEQEEETGGVDVEMQEEEETTISGKVIPIFIGADRKVILPHRISLFDLILYVP